MILGVGSVTLLLCWCSIGEPGNQKMVVLHMNLIICYEIGTFLCKRRSLFMHDLTRHELFVPHTVGVCCPTFGHCSRHGVGRPAVPATGLVKVAFCGNKKRDKMMTLDTSDTNMFDVDPAVLGEEGSNQRPTR